MELLSGLLQEFLVRAPGQLPNEFVFEAFWLSFRRGYKAPPQERLLDLLPSAVRYPPFWPCSFISLCVCEKGWALECNEIAPLSAIAMAISTSPPGQSSDCSELRGGNLGPGRLLAAPPPRKTALARFRCSAHVCVFCAQCLRRYKEVCKVLSVSNTMFCCLCCGLSLTVSVSLCVFLDNQSGLSAVPLSFWGI